MSRKIPDKKATRSIKEIKKFFDLYPTLAAGCAALGVCAPSATYWLSGRCHPTPATALKMEELSGGIVRAATIARCLYDLDIKNSESFKDYVIRKFILSRADRAYYKAAEIDEYIEDVYSIEIRDILELDAPQEDDIPLLVSLFGSTEEHWCAIKHKFWVAAAK